MELGSVNPILRSLCAQSAYKAGSLGVDGLFALLMPRRMEGKGRSKKQRDAEE